VKITAVSIHEADIPLSRPYTIATASYDRVTNFVVQVSAGDCAGLGVASPDPDVTGESADLCRAALAPPRLEWLVGEDLRHCFGLCRQLAEKMLATPAARAAVDMALHDLLARRLEVPLFALLGGQARGLATSVTIGIESVKDTIASAREYVAAGFHLLKIKLGRDLETDVERLHRVREVCGRDIGIRVDANQGYDLEQTLAFAARTADLGIELIEQPMPTGRPEPMAALPADLRRRVAADESLLTEADALRLAGPPPLCGIYNIKLMKCGGIWSARRMADLAKTAEIELMWGCMDESVIGIAAALHTALASPATRYVDLDGSFDLACDPATGGFTLRDGVLFPVECPGLGAELI
jgi:L-Ala-D/L-Glu epimerase / N-acetyl-D-glutamate racemase